jgi:outer membrane receptor for ferrienterochelin and colicin
VVAVKHNDRDFGCVAVLAASLLAGMPIKASAELDLTDLSLQQLLDIDVVGASRFEQKSSTAPASVSVVTADDIRAYGYRTLADILNGTRSLYVSYDRTTSISACAESTARVTTTAASCCWWMAIASMT